MNCTYVHTHTHTQYTHVISKSPRQQARLINELTTPTHVERVKSNDVWSFFLFNKTIIVENPMVAADILL